MTKTLRKFFPIHSTSCDLCSQENQRYRNPFNDQRRAARVDRTVEHLSRCRSRQIADFSFHRKDVVATRRLLANDEVKLGELIDYCYDFPEDSIKDESLLVLGDGSSLNVNLSGHGDRVSWARKHSSLVNSKVAGFQFMCGLVIGQHSHEVKGLSDMVLYDSPRDMRTQEKRHAERLKRLKLKLHERESGGWTILADNSMRKLSLARQVTFVYDREADSYENMTYLRQVTGADFIIRQKYNRKASNDTGREDNVLNLIEEEAWQDVKLKKTRRLNHYCKKKRKKRTRQGRHSRLKIRYVKVTPCLPDGYHKYHTDREVMDTPLYWAAVT